MSNTHYPPLKVLEKLKSFRLDRPDRSWLEQRQHVYIWEYPNARTTPAFTRLSQSDDGLWRGTWYGYGRPEPDYHMQHMGISTNFLHTMVNRSEMFIRLIRSQVHMDSYTTHELDTIPPYHWANIWLLSPYGTVRRLKYPVADKGGRWLVQTVLANGSPLNAYLAHDEIRELVRRYRWLVLIPGDREPLRDETAAQYASKRWL